MVSVTSLQASLVENLSVPYRNEDYRGLVGLQDLRLDTCMLI